MITLVHLTNFGFSYSSEPVKEGSIISVKGESYKVIGACGLTNTNNFDEDGNEVDAFLELEKM